MWGVQGLGLGLGLGFLHKAQILKSTLHIDFLQQEQFMGTIWLAEILSWKTVSSDLLHGFPGNRNFGQLLARRLKMSHFQRWNSQKHSLEWLYLVKTLGRWRFEKFSLVGLAKPPGSLHLCLVIYLFIYLCQPCWPHGTSWVTSPSASGQICQDWWCPRGLVTRWAKAHNRYFPPLTMMRASLSVCVCVCVCVCVFDVCVCVCRCRCLCGRAKSLF